MPVNKTKAVVMHKVAARRRPNVMTESKGRAYLADVASSLDVQPQATRPRPFVVRPCGAGRQFSLPC
jgi:hypothetical protein